MSGLVDVKQHYSKKKSSQKQQSHYEGICHHSSMSSVRKHSYAAHKSSQVITSTGAQLSFVQLEKESEFIPSQLLPRRVKKYLAMDPDTNELIGYVIPVFRTSHEFARGLVEVQEEVKEESVGQVAMRNLFSRETSSMEMVTVEKKSRKKHMRESAECVQLSKKIEDRVELRKKQNTDNLTHPPEFIVRPRGQTVWEGETVKLHCTVAGWPKPRVAWYKNNVLIDGKTHPEKYTVESNYNMHCLEIINCDFLDTAQYRASALNIKGERSYLATVVIKRFQEERERGLLDAKPRAVTLKVCEKAEGFDGVEWAEDFRRPAQPDLSHDKNLREQGVMHFQLWGSQAAEQAKSSPSLVPRIRPSLPITKKRKTWLKPLSCLLKEQRGQPPLWVWSVPPAHLYSLPKGRRAERSGNL
ncbi:hypothetical protein DPEC_G00053380 [Dallia pectoralis]|uniref:Uncharacterized protein n=1 Tax=Dallia pectoralis TaxID=75939 RepID=A0ACC2H528_DALPE|nr:hypothetical protein DPEC_G00053380 [Dallia pectoralis]